MLQVRSVKPIPDFLLHLVFSNGEQRQFDMCRIPSDHIPIRSWPLFLARELMRDLIETLKAEQST